MINIFISHKRQDGIASSEAILLYEILKRKPYYRVFMDVRESYIGEFPRVLASRIMNSDVFILLLPPKDSLLDRNSWVHKEIKTALYSHEYKSRPKKILPITFGPSYVLPDKDELGDIEDILNYSIYFFDKNDPNAKSRLYQAIGISKFFYFKRIIALLLVILILFLGLNKIKLKSRYQTPQIVEYTASLSKLNSLNAFLDNYDKPTLQFLSWYLKELDNKDLKINQEFNQAYVKEGIIRLTVLAYLAFTSGDLNAEQDVDYVNNLIEDCYSAIPEDMNNPISFNSADDEDRDNAVKEIIHVSIKTLNQNKNLKSIPEEGQQALALTIYSKVWPQ